MEVMGMLADQENTQKALHTLSDEAFTELLAVEIDRRPSLRPVRDDLVALLSMGPALALRQERAVSNPAASAAARDRVVTSAKRSIVDEHDMLDSKGVSRALGLSPNSRNTASRLAAAGKVIAIPAGGQNWYPSFQFDHDRQQVRPIVEAVNQLLSAKDDPWGTASWWLNSTAFADDPRSPAELAVDGSCDEEIRAMAHDLLGD
ncbi:hypothetical protein [Rhodococcus sp. NPDC058521]|uniref:hypothetical protein n=1 Tax=Rhodococcus sp. NPDC058521 TaxID=3346536 RepID=UPI00364A80AA